MRVAATIDTQLLSPEQANEIEDMVKGLTVEPTGSSTG